MSDTKFFRKYLDILNEGPPPGVGPNAQAAPKAPPANQPLGGYDPKSGKAPTQQQADNLMGQIDAAGNQVAQGGEKIGAGNYVGGAMDAARGVNNALNAAGATTADKLKMGWTGLKAGTNAGLAYLRGKGEEGALAAAAGTVGQDLTQPMADYAKSKTFDKDFNQAMSAPTSNDPKMAQMQQDAQRNLITSNSMKNYMTGVNQTMGDLKSGDTTAYDRLGQQTMYRQDTMSPYLDISKKQAMTGQRVQTPGELMGQEEEPPEPNTNPQPTTEEKDDMDNTQLMRKYMDYLDEAPAQAINPNDPDAASFGKQINAPGNQPPGLAAATTGGGYTNQANRPATQTNVDTRATAQRDKLAQQMASGKINTPAPQTIDPNQQYGGGYDKTKVQYASGGNPAQTASATQSAALDASKKNASSGYTAQSQAQNTLDANTQKSAPTFTGMAGNPQQIKGANAQRASEPSLASQYIQANQPQSAPVAKPASAPASEPSLASQYVQANQPQAVAEEEHGEDDELLKSIIRLIKQ